jgi:hypothetical protein
MTSRYPSEVLFGDGDWASFLKRRQRIRNKAHGDRLWLSWPPTHRLREVSLNLAATAALTAWTRKGTVFQAR